MEDNTYNVELKIEQKKLKFSQGGKYFTIPVHVKNNSKRDLLESGMIFLSYHIYALDGELVRWDNNRTKIQLMRGEEGTVIITDTLPARKGNYLFQIDIVKEGVEWYSVKGMDCPSVLVDVLAHGSLVGADLEREIEKQKEVEKDWEDKLKSGQYDFYSPYIKLDPYGKSPLSAVLLFTSEDDMAVSLHIEGKTENACVHAEFPEYTTRHIIPVYGLYAGENNIVRIKGRDTNGNIVKNEIPVATNPLGHGFENINLITYVKDEKKYSSGLNFCYTGLENKGMKMAYDINGDIRWYFSEYFTEQTKYVSSSSVWVCRNDGRKEASIMEYNLMGRLQSIYCSPYGLHHDIQFSTKNTMLLLGAVGDIEFDILVEIDLETGKVIYVNDYKKMLQRTRNVSVLYSNTDWLHMNAVVEDKEDFIISGKGQSTVLKHDRNGKIKWMLADPIGYGTYWKQFLLKPVGRKFEYPYNQHAIEILPDADGNPDTIDILMFDNGYSRNKCNKLDNEEHPLYSRMVHYRINEKEKTVRQIWEYGKERPELFSMWRGDADLQSNGNIIGVFNARDKNEMDGINYTEHCNVVEVDRKKNVIWECYGSSAVGRNSYQNYRIERKEIYDKVEKNIDIGQEVRIRLGDII